MSLVLNPADFAFWNFLSVTFASTFLLSLLSFYIYSTVSSNSFFILSLAGELCFKNSSIGSTVTYSECFAN